MSVFAQKPEPLVGIELDEGEEILYCARRHWIVLLQWGLPVVVLMLITSGVAIYRSIGGTFIESNVSEAGRFDLFGALILILVVILGVFWYQPRRRNPKKPPAGIPYLVAIAVLLLAFAFRIQGGRLFYIDPFTQRGVDGLNLVLLVVSIGLFLLLVYLVQDWSNDYLILTNLRVIDEDRREIPILQIVVSQLQQQMLVDDIQQVNVRADSYLEYWLGYGSIIIRSFSPRRLVFANAADPQTMQQKILSEVGKIRKQQSPEILRQMIEDQVYGNKPPPGPSRPIQVKQQNGPIRWLFPPNPEFQANDTMIWRPSWIYTFAQMARPILTLLLGTVGMVFLNRFGLPGTWTILLWFLLLLGCGFWVFWVREEYQNDVYILTRQDISDVDKKPFGPENRRRAPLSAIQDTTFNVTFWENLLGYGNVTVETGGAGGGKFTFLHVPDPRGVQATINDYLTDFRKFEKERQQRDTITLLKEYHAVQSAHGEVINQERIVSEVMNRVLAETRNGNLPAQDHEPIAVPLPQQIRREARAAVRNELSRFRRRTRRRL